MDKEVLVKVEGLSKKFCKDLKTSLWYGVKDLITGIRGVERPSELRSKEFWAVKDVSFELRRGECLGLIGHNGAGKSTLLKILNGLINPDEGKVTIKGRVGALIELGAGFNPILSGRENIYNNGAILGFSREEIDKKLNEIIAFAELEEFIDMPVQHYSSGMKVRLGFAVAAQMEPDVLIIDEVLAVGDLGFVLKCFKQIDDIIPNTAVLFVSHNMPMVSRICNKVILMEKGVSKFDGYNVSSAIDSYYGQFLDNESNIIYDEGIVSLEEIKLKSKGKGEEGELHWGNQMKLHIKLAEITKVDPFEFSIYIYDKEQRAVALLERNDEDYSEMFVNGKLSLEVTIPKIQLSKGIYNITITIRNKKSKAPILRINNVLSFQIIHDQDLWVPFLLESDYQML